VDADVGRLEEAQGRLGALIEAYVRTGRKINQHTIDHIEGLVRDFRTHERLKGLDFPKCVVIVLPTVNAVQIWRADLDGQSVQVSTTNLIRMYWGRYKSPEEMVKEVSATILAAYPQYRPQVDTSLRPEIKGLS
jgi:hypothetical protein